MLGAVEAPRSSGRPSKDGQRLGKALTVYGSGDSRPPEAEGAAVAREGWGGVAARCHTDDGAGQHPQPRAPATSSRMGARLARWRSDSRPASPRPCEPSPPTSVDSRLADHGGQAGIRGEVHDLARVLEGVGQERIGIGVVGGDGLAVDADRPVVAPAADPDAGPAGPASVAVPTADPQVGQGRALRLAVPDRGQHRPDRRPVERSRPPAVAGGATPTRPHIVRARSSCSTRSPRPSSEGPRSSSRQPRHLLRHGHVGVLAHAAPARRGGDRGPR